MTTISSAFSSSETEALQREVNFADDEPEVSFEQIWNDKQINKCVEWIRSNGYTKICLQFPDNYLQHSERIASSIKANVGDSDVKTFILADTSYGSCCVDEIAAAHVDADSMIHFGNACRSKASRLPVLYNFPQFELDMDKFGDYINTLATLVEEQIFTIYLDIGYHHLLGPDFVVKFGEKIKNLNAKKIFIVSYCGDSYGTLEQDGKITIKSGDYSNEIDEMDETRVCLFVGGDNRRFFNISLTTKANAWYIYDVASSMGKENNPLTANYIRRRYFYIEKCKDAQTLGLIVATLTTDGYLEIIKHLQTMAKARGIKTQIISVGRINPAKLANFLEIDCFVLIGCPFNNMFESKEYYKPIVSVFEAEMALNPAWHMRYPESYVTDFKDLLPQGRSFLEFNANDINPEDVSLLTGRLRHNGTNDNVTEVVDLSALSDQQKAVATRAGMEVMTANTGLSFEDRTWQGLDPSLGQTEPAILQKGLRGIPIKYTND